MKDYKEKKYTKVLSCNATVCVFKRKRLFFK